jgi:hypothetical protein
VCVCVWVWVWGVCACHCCAAAGWASCEAGKSYDHLQHAAHPLSHRFVQLRRWTLATAQSSLEACLNPAGARATHCFRCDDDVATTALIRCCRGGALRKIEKGLAHRRSWADEVTASTALSTSFFQRATSTITDQVRVGGEMATRSCLPPPPPLPPHRLSPFFVRRMPPSTLASILKLAAVIHQEPRKRQAPSLLAELSPRHRTFLRRRNTPSL